MKKLIVESYLLSVTDRHTLYVHYVKSEEEDLMKLISHNYYHDSKRILRKDSHDL